jgi:hypothetical protein
MPRQTNPVFNSIIYYAMMSAMDRIGINPALFARQTATAISPIMKQVAGSLGLKMPKTLQEFGELQNEFDNMDNIPDAERTEVSQNDGTITLKLHNCGFLDVSNYVENLGYKQCPVCLIGAVNIGLLKTLNIAEIKDFKVEKNNTDCIIHLISAQRE